MQHIFHAPHRQVCVHDELETTRRLKEVQLVLAGCVVEKAILPEVPCQGLDTNELFSPHSVQKISVIRSNQQPDYIHVTANRDFNFVSFDSSMNCIMLLSFEKKNSPYFLNETPFLALMNILLIISY